jgi:hypothetical protein
MSWLSLRGVGPNASSRLFRLLLRNAIPRVNLDEPSPLRLYTHCCVLRHAITDDMRKARLARFAEHQTSSDEMSGPVMG